MHRPTNLYRPSKTYLIKPIVSSDRNFKTVAMQRIEEWREYMLEVMALPTDLCARRNLFLEELRTMPWPFEYMQGTEVDENIDL